MARSLPLTAYLALRGADAPHRPAPPLPDVPAGVIVWAICAEASMLEKADIMGRELIADGDQITVLRTCAATLDVTEQQLQNDAPMPLGRAETKRFISHFNPSLVMFCGDILDPLIITEIQAANIPVISVEATQAVAKPADRQWIPGLTRAVLTLFDMIFAKDAAAAKAIVQAGARPEQIKLTGGIEAAPPVLSYNEGERRDFADTLGTRPVWLAAEISLKEMDALANAHYQASRRAHRLLMIVALRDREQWRTARDLLEAKGFDVAIRFEDQDITDATQIYLVDGDEDLGLWYRAAPVTYLGETLTGAPRRHPFEAASLGTALVCGPRRAPYAKEIDALVRVGGCMTVTSAEGLGDAIERLLSADKTAQIVHAAWDITTQGADIVQRMAALIHELIDKRGQA